MKTHLKSLALCKSECLGSESKLDPKLFTGQVGFGSKTRRKMGSESEQNSFGSTTLVPSFQIQGVPVPHLTQRNCKNLRLEDSVQA
jgi:hypothetical protein